MTKHLKVGDEVFFNLVNRKVKGKIIEDRGKIGAHHSHLWRVRVPFLSSPSMDYELSEDQLESVSKYAAHA